MAIHTFAAIYIGSYEVSLKIFELSSKKKLHGIDYVRRRIEMGKDVYSTGAIGYELVDVLCGTLREYLQIAGEYRAEHCEAYAAAVLRYAENDLFVLDQIRLRTGLSVHVLSNSEHRFINYKALAIREEFEDMIRTSAAMVDVGGAGMQITIFSEGKVVTTQHLVIGTLRLREQLAHKSGSLTQYERQVEEMVVREIEGFRELYMGEQTVEHLIIAGDYISELVRKVEKNRDQRTVDVQKVIRYLEHLGKRSLKQIAEELELASESDELMIPYLIICKCLAERLGASSLWVPGAMVSDGIACEYAEKNRLYKPSHDFDKDILSASRSMAARYQNYFPHIDMLVETSLLIYDAMKKEHGLGKRERLLLQVAAILHDCGKYISFSNAPRCAHDIILASEILGLSHLERMIVADVVLYHTVELPAYGELADRLDRGSYLVVAKLSAILRVANAMDRSHRQKIRNVRAQVKEKEKELVITLETTEDIALERSLFAAKAGYFERIFSIKPVIREKRIYQP